MAHNSYIRPGNVWSGSKTFLTVELTALALQVYQSLNADLGGTWAPAAVITIGGAGMTVTGPSQLDDLRYFSQTSGASQFLNASGLTFYDTSIQLFTETSTLALSADANLTVGGDVDVTVSTTHTVQWSAPLHFSAGLHTYDGITIAGAQTRTGKTTLSGSGGRTIYRVQTLANTNSTVGNDHDSFIYQQTNDTNHGLILRTSETSVGAGDQASLGERIWVNFIRTVNKVGHLSVSCESGADIVTFGVNGPDADPHDNRGAALFEFDGTRWRLLSYWGTGTTISALDP